MDIGRVPTVLTGADEAQVSSKNEKANGKGSAGNESKISGASESQKRGRASDRVVISEDARARLAEMADAARAEGVVAPAPEEEDGLRIEKMQLAMARIRSGYYDRPEIQEQIADRLADELRTRPPDNPEEPEQS